MFPADSYAVMYCMFYPTCMTPAGLSVPVSLPVNLSTENKQVTCACLRQLVLVLHLQLYLPCTLPYASSLPATVPTAPPPLSPFSLQPRIAGTTKIGSMLIAYMHVR